MSIIPILFRDSFMDDFLRPSRVMEKSFFDGGFPSDFLVAIDNIPAHRGCKRRSACAPQSQTDKSLQKKTRENFEVSVDVQNFKPEEISVRMVDNFITVEGKHEEKQDEHGFVSRHFVRKYRLPEGHDLDKVVSSLSSDGVLTVKAPRLALTAAPEIESTIPVIQTGKLANQQRDENHSGKENQTSITDNSK